MLDEQLKIQRADYARQLCVLENEKEASRPAFLSTGILVSEQIPATEKDRDRHIQSLKAAIAQIDVALAEAFR